jgi:hypothetical protein
MIRPPSSPWRSVVAIAVLAIVAFAAVTIAMSREVVESPFAAENSAAMAKMMAGMAVAPSGDVDRDFVAMMIPHHEGAIDMAQAELRHGGNEQLRRIAQEIVVEQQQEIVAMRLALGQPPPPSNAASTQVAAGADRSSRKEASPWSGGWSKLAASICRSRR